MHKNSLRQVVYRHRINVTIPVSRYHTRVIAVVYTIQDDEIVALLFVIQMPNVGPVSKIKILYQLTRYLFVSSHVV